MWLDLLNAAVNRSSKQSVARELGVSRTTISLVVDGKYPAKTDSIEKKVIEVYGNVDCPHLAQEISLNACRNYHQSNVPTSSPRAMKHWQACKTCPNNKGGQHETL